MRFRAQLFSPETLLLFTQALGKIGKRIVVVLDPTEIRFMSQSTLGSSVESRSLDAEFASGTASFDRLVAYGATSIENLFDSVVCESATENAIAFSVRADALEKALKGHRGRTCLVKLTKNRASLLPTLEISSLPVRSAPKNLSSCDFANGFPQSETAHAHLTQQISIALVAKHEWKSALVEPALGQPDVYINAPTPLAQLKQVLGKIGAHGEHIEIGINMSHKLSLAVEDAQVGAICTEWRGLEHPKYVDKDQVEIAKLKHGTADADTENEPERADPFALDDDGDADATENETVTRVHVNKGVLSKLLGACEYFSEGGKEKARVILCATERKAFVAHVVKPANTYISVYAPLSML